jgi:chorismate mutase
VSIREIRGKSPFEEEAMMCRGIRGAVCAKANTAEAILLATRELLERIVAENGVDVADIACVWFTATSDLDAAYPARAARELGWTLTPLMCAQEMAVAGSLPRCIRVLVMWNTPVPGGDPTSTGGGQTLRPDLQR